ncbi:hypothetical protein GQX43_14330 [Staphylococcus aureus]|nr:hypothetical protein [Staphylococcus aureus]
MLFYVGLEFVVLWRYKNAVLWRFQNGVSINKPQQDLDLTMTYTFHTYIHLTKKNMTYKVVNYRLYSVR